VGTSARSTRHLPWSSLLRCPLRKVRSRDLTAPSALAAGDHGDDVGRRAAGRSCARAGGLGHRRHRAHGPIRGFDLRLINGQLLRGGKPHLESVLALDTKSDLYATHGRSLSQKNLASEIGVAAPKIDVTLYDWEAFNTRVPGFKEKGIERVRGDVIQNCEMREKLIEMGWLGPPRLWRPKPSGSSRYTA
jgi:hypothetical protein